MVEGGRFRGEAPARLAFLREVLDGLDVPGLDPIDTWDDPAHVAGRPRRQYVQYLGRSAPEHWEFRLPVGFPGERPEPGDEFEVDVIDTWHMTVERAAGRFSLTDVGRNEARDGASAPVRLPQGEAVALLITRVEPAR
jgi:hypothetical protein